MMKIERYSKKESIEAMNTWISNSFTLPPLGKDYATIRKDLNELFLNAKSMVENNVKSYEMDVHFGANLYGFLTTKSWFTDRLACDDGFWRYLSLRVVPDLVGERWGNTNADHYYSKPSRIWLKTLWWYFHLSLNNSDVDATKEMLLKTVFSTDTILNLVERTGRCGTNISVYRNIMKSYSSRNEAVDKDFRKVMKLNTAKAVVIEPAFYAGGIQGYVDSLFKELTLL